jgi:hypothetical protein
MGEFSASPSKNIESSPSFTEISLVFHQQYYPVFPLCDTFSPDISKPRNPQL